MTLQLKREERQAEQMLADRHDHDKMCGATDMEEERKVPKSDGEKLASKYNLPFVETSAKLGHGVDEAFYGIAKLVSKRIFASSGGSASSEKNKKVSLENEAGRRRGCC